MEESNIGKGIQSMKKQLKEHGVKEYLTCLFKDGILFNEIIGTPNVRDFSENDAWKWIIDVSQELKEQGITADVPILKEQIIKLLFDGLLKTQVNKCLSAIETLLLDNDYDLTYWKNNIKEWIRRNRIKHYLDSVADEYKEWDLDKVENQLGLSNPFESKDSILTDYTPTQWMERYGDIEKQIQETSIYNKGFICRGEMTEIVAIYGCGKSVFVNQLAFFGAHGKNCCGWDTGGKKIKVLIIQPEDVGVKQTRIFESQLKRNSDNGNVRVLYWTSIDRVTLDKIMTEFKPDVIIINPLYRFADTTKKLQTPEAFTPILSMIQELIIKHNCACIVVHHLRKDGEDEFGPAILKWFFRKTIYIKKYGTRPGYYIFDVDKGEYESGDIHGTIIRHSTEENDLFWFVSDFKEAGEEKVNERKYTTTILSVLSDIPIGPREIERKTQINSGTISTELNRLVQLNMVEKNDKGKYTRIDRQQNILK